MVFSLITPDLQNPYTINYQLNIQRQLRSDLMWEIGYVGTQYLFAATFLAAVLPLSGADTTASVVEQYGYVLFGLSQQAAPTVRHRS